MKIRNAERVVLWSAPMDSADYENSLTDAFVSMPRGKTLVYAVGMSGLVPSQIMNVGHAVAGRKGGALVQWPNDDKDNDKRTWCFGIEKSAPVRP